MVDAAVIGGKVVRPDTSRQPGRTIRGSTTTKSRDSPPD
jgi:hypothetical protein